jgi:hypothetical protein
MVGGGQFMINLINVSISFFTADTAGKVLFHEALLIVVFLFLRI